MSNSFYTCYLEISNSSRVKLRLIAPQEPSAEPTKPAPPPLWGKLDYAARKPRLDELQTKAFKGHLELKESQELGESLFHTLLDPSLIDLFVTFCDKVRQKEGLLRLVLDIDEEEMPDLAALPWEMLRVPPQHGALWLGAIPGVVLSRARGDLRRDPAWLRVKPDEKLRVAMAVAAPTNPEPGKKKLGEVAYEPIWAKLYELAQANGDVEVLPLLNPATPAGIDRLLRDKPHIFHFIGHGQLKKTAKASSGQIALVEPYSKTPSWQEAAEFGGLFARFRPAVVLLQACEGAAPDSSRAFVSVAAHLIQQNIPLVVAMQYEISNLTGQAFATSFYEHLLKNRTQGVGQAVQESRNDLRLWVNTSPDFATPVLFSRIEDDLLWSQSLQEPTQPTDIHKQAKDKEAKMPTPNPDMPQDFEQKLGMQQFFALVRLLAACPTFNTTAGQAGIKTLMPTNIQHRWPSASVNPQQDITAIVQVCQHFSLGRKTLLDLVITSENGSTEGSNLEAFTTQNGLV